MSKQFRMIIATVCLCALFAGCAAPEATVEQTVTPAAPTPDLETPVEVSPMSVLTLMGEVQEISSEGQVRVVGDENSYDYSDVALKLTDGTAIIDPEGNVKASEDIETGMQVTAYFSAMMTRSLPPQTEAFAIILGTEQTADGYPNYIEVQNIEQQEDGSDLITSSNGDLLVTITEDTAIATVEGAAATVDDIAAGTRLFAWYQAVSLSYPAQATALRVMIL